MSTKTKQYETPREAAAAVIEINNTYRVKLAKASSLIKEKNSLIRNLQASRAKAESDNDYIKKLEGQIQSLILENQEYESKLSEYEDLQSENVFLKERLDNITTTVSNITTTVSNMKQATSPAVSAVSVGDGTPQQRLELIKQNTQDFNKQLLMASMHISGLDAELKSFKENHPESDLLNASDESYEDGRRKSVARIIYENAFDKRGMELGIHTPDEFRPR